MDLSSSSKSINNKTKSDSRTRRIWTPQEEAALIAGLKEIITQDWKVENGFKTGYLKVLKTYMMKAIPGTELRASPHIISRLATWKKNYSSLSSMMAMSGFGWDDKKKMIDVPSDQVWQEYVMKDPNAKLMRYKMWPFYPDWIEIFGKDRASGQHAEDFGDAMIDLTDPSMSDLNGKSPSNNSDKVVDVGDESDDSPISNGSGSFISKKRVGSKRKAPDFAVEMIEMLKQFCADANATLREVALRMGYEFDVSKARKEVFAVVDAMEGLTDDEKFDVSSLLVTKTEYLELFFSLPEDKKKAFALWVRARGGSGGTV